MPKQPQSIEEITEEFKTKIQLSSKKGGFLNRNDDFPNRHLIQAWIAQALTQHEQAVKEEERERIKKSIQSQPCKEECQIFKDRIIKSLSK